MLPNEAEDFHPSNSKAQLDGTGLLQARDEGAPRKSYRIVLHGPGSNCTTCTNVLKHAWEPLYEIRPSGRGGARHDLWHNEVEFPRIASLASYAAITKNSKKHRATTQSFQHLVSKCSQCGFCRYLRSILIASLTSPENQPPSEDDLIHIEAFTAGSVSDPVSHQYERCHRLRVQIFYSCNDDYPAYRLTKGGDLGPSNQPHPNRLYRVGPYFTLLPMKEADSEASSPDSLSDRSLLFCGRRVTPRLDLNLLRHWLGTCVNDHNHFDGITAPPTKNMWGREMNPRNARPASGLKDFRLINVQRRCVVTADTSTRYVALSYVWGRSRRLLLTQTNLSRLSSDNGLSPAHFEDIPKTFQDAMQLTADLNYEYLWIDALCIQQDDGHVLNAHMEEMDAIYGVADLTIVSTLGDVDSGLPGMTGARGSTQLKFYFPRHEGQDQDRDQASTPSQPPSQVSERPTMNVIINSKKSFAQAVEGTIWESRGWTLQEKLFSKRLLIFTSQQAFFHCSVSTFLEDTILEPRMMSTFQNPLHSRTQRIERPYLVTLMERGRPYTKVRQRYSVPYHMYDNNKPLFQQDFWSIVESYAKRSLTFEADMVSAFRGVLRSMEDLHGIALWGVPIRMFNAGLTWKYQKHRMDMTASCIDARVVHNKPADRMVMSRARREGFPSWSWTGWNFDKEHLLEFKDVYGLKSTIVVDWYYYEKDDPNTTTTTGSTKSVGETENQNSYVGYTLKRLMPDHVPHRYENWCYGSSNHPGGTDFDFSTLPPITKTLPFVYVPSIMPPLSHILRFYTSVATLFVKLTDTPETKAKARPNLGSKPSSEWAPITQADLSKNSGTWSSDPSFDEPRPHRSVTTHDPSMLVYDVYDAETKQKHLLSVQLDKKWAEKSHAESRKRTALSRRPDESGDNSGSVSTGGEPDLDINVSSHHSDDVKNVDLDGFLAEFIVISQAFGIPSDEPDDEEDEEESFTGDESWEVLRKRYVRPHIDLRVLLVERPLIPPPTSTSTSGRARESRGEHDSDNGDDDDSTQGWTISPIYYRVQLCSETDNHRWSKGNPEWKMIALA